MTDKYVFRSLTAAHFSVSHSMENLSLLTEDLMEKICIYLNGIFRELFKKSRHRQKLLLLLTLKYKNSRRQTNFTSSYQWSKIVKSIGHAKIYWFHSRKIGFGSCSSTLKQHVGVFFDSFILPEGLPLQQYVPNTASPQLFKRCCVRLLQNQ